MRLVSAVPIIPSQEMSASVGWYRDMLGFTVHHVEVEYGIVGRDDVFIHFWGPSGITPHESMTMIRVGVADVEAWYEHCLPLGIVHPNAPLDLKEWGSTEFGLLDIDGNLVTLFEFKQAP